MAREQIEAMKRRSDLPAGVVIEQRKSTSSSSSSAVAIKDTEEFNLDDTETSPDLINETPSSGPGPGPDPMKEPEDDDNDDNNNANNANTANMTDTAPDTTQDEQVLDQKIGNSSTKSLGSTSSITPSKPIEDDFYAMKIESTGKYSRKADLDDIARFAKLEKVDSDKLKEWLKNYLEQNFPDQLEKPNCIPRSAHVKDDPKKGFDAFGTYGWKTIKLNLQPGLIEVKDQWTKEIVLEQFQLDYSTDLEKALMEKGDKEVVSTLRKGPMAGHPLALDLFKKVKKGEESQIVTEFRGMDSVVFQLGNNQGAAKKDEETGDLVWRDVKKLRAILKDKPLPKKTGKGVTRTVDVLALESYMKARVYYKASFTGSVSTDHGNEQFDGRRYWNWDLKYLLRYNDIPNAVVMYQDIELKFFSKIRFDMENEDWEWVNNNGTWMKQKLTKPADD